MRTRVVAVEGIIGSGKSTLTKQIAEAMNLRPLFEPVETNPYLEDFYKDPRKHAFPMQIELLMQRYNMQQLAARESVHGVAYSGAILDRSLPGDRVFCELHRRGGNISEREWNTYENAYRIMTCSLIPPSVLIYLDVDPSIALNRVQKRARGAESTMSLEYLSQLRAGYLDMLSEIEAGGHAWSRGMDIIRLPWNTDHLSVEPILFAIHEKLGIEYQPAKPATVAAISA
jgi:deoxyadenosine/deoxycytidine kinase